MAGIYGLLIFEFPVPAHTVMKTHHELRRTVEGRKQLVEQGVSMTGYRRGQGKFYSAVPFTERRFVSWDGEGTLGDNYSLFGNSDGKYIHAPSLSTSDCLELLIDAADIDAIHFGFAFTYDVNKILRDLSAQHLQILHKKGSVCWRRWRIEYRPRKWFLVTDRHIGKTVRIWDVWSFFMTSAVKAWKEYGVEVSEGVIRGKEARGTQSYEDLFPEVYEYWYEENQAYVALMDKLRESLHSAGLYISAWHGPGAIASYSLSKHHIERAMARCPDAVNDAAQYAYGGGRFELFKVGRACKPVYEYDVNSAYPYAISQLPNLSKGIWRHNTDVGEIVRFGVYRVTLKLNPFEKGHTLRAMPFLNRDNHGLISFPCVGETWVWSPELWGKENFPGLTIHEGWEFIEDDENDRPFKWLAENYHIRKLYKKAGNQAQYALKLQMNSMYGKMAQRVGWNEEKFTAPKWHQLEWAGWVTSYCRSMVFHAALLAGSDLVAFETDAVFSTKRLWDRLDIGDNLGQWEETIYNDFVYLQSGCRFGLCAPCNKHVEPTWHPKYRGFDPDSIKLEECLEAFSREPDEWYVEGRTSRFIGFAQALHTDFATWGTFQNDKSRVLHMGGEGKRRHIPKLCRACRDGIPASEGFHDCALAVPIADKSYKHPLPWKLNALDKTQLLADAQKWEQQSLEDI